MQLSQLESLMSNLQVSKVGDNFEDKILTDSHLSKLFNFICRRQFWVNDVFWKNFDSWFSPPKTFAQSGFRTGRLGGEQFPSSWIGVLTVGWNWITSVHPVSLDLIDSAQQSHIQDVWSPSLSPDCIVHLMCYIVNVWLHCPTYTKMNFRLNQMNHGSKNRRNQFWRAFLSYNFF